MISIGIKQIYRWVLVNGWNIGCGIPIRSCIILGDRGCYTGVYKTTHSAFRPLNWEQNDK